MSWDEVQGPVLYRAKRARGFAKDEKSFDPQDFLARLLMHDRAAEAEAKASHDSLLRQLF